jgi:hypothetical protein
VLGISKSKSGRVGTGGVSYGMATRNDYAIYHRILHTLCLWYNHGLARAFRIFCRCGLAGILIDLDHLPNIVAQFLGTSPVPAGRLFHKITVIICWYCAGCLSALYIGLLASGPTDDEIARTVK